MTPVSVANLRAWRDGGQPLTRRDSGQPPTAETPARRQQPTAEATIRRRSPVA